MAQRLATWVVLFGCWAAVGCQNAELEGDCLERLVWKGQEYGGLRGRPPAGESLGRTWTYACKERHQRVRIRRLIGVHPSIGVAVQPRGRHRYIGLGPGYIVESPRHPMHRAAFGSDNEPDEYEYQRCHAPRTVPARALATPIHENRALTVAAERRRHTGYIEGRGVQGVLSFDARSVVEGFDRHGVPHIRAGDRFRARLRACRYGRDAPDGLRGLAKLIVVRVTRSPD
jgi:hypothetical protein